METESQMVNIFQQMKLPVLGFGYIVVGQRPLENKDIYIMIHKTIKIAAMK